MKVPATIAKKEVKNIGLKSKNTSTRFEARKGIITKGRVRNPVKWRKIVKGKRRSRLPDSTIEEKKEPWDTMTMDLDHGPSFMRSRVMDGDILVGSGVVGNKEDGLKDGTELTKVLLPKEGKDKEMNSTREGPENLKKYEGPK